MEKQNGVNSYYWKRAEIRIDVNKPMFSSALGVERNTSCK